MLEEKRGGLGDVAGAEGKDEVAFRGAGGYGLGGGWEVWGEVGRGAFGLDGGGEDLAGDAGEGRFAGGVDGDEFDGVGVAESGGEVVKEVAGARVAVWLEEDVDAPVAKFAGGGKGGADFGGVVAVVVDDGDAAGGAFVLEAAVDAAEAA